MSSIKWRKLLFGCEQDQKKYVSDNNYFVKAAEETDSLMYVLDEQLKCIIEINFCELSKWNDKSYSGSIRGALVMDPVDTQTT